MALGFKMGASGKVENDNIKTYILRNKTSVLSNSSADIPITLDLPDGIDTSNKIVAQVSVAGYTPFKAGSGYYISTGFLSYNIDLENKTITVTAHQITTSDNTTTTIITFITLYEIKKYKNSWHRASVRNRSSSYSPVYNSLAVNITDLNKVLVIFNYTDSNGSIYYPYELKNNLFSYYYLQSRNDGFDKYGVQIDVVEYE